MAWLADTVKVARARLAAALAGLAALLTLGAPGAALADWVRAESDSFVVYGAGDERAVRAYAAKLEAFDDILRAYHGMAPDQAATRKFEVYLVASANQLRRIKPDANDSMGGFY